MTAVVARILVRVAVDFSCNFCFISCICNLCSCNNYSTCRQINELSNLTSSCSSSLLSSSLRSVFRKAIERATLAVVLACSSAALSNPPPNATTWQPPQRSQLSSGSRLDAQDTPAFLEQRQHGIGSLVVGIRPLKVYFCFLFWWSSSSILIATCFCVAALDEAPAPASLAIVVATESLNFCFLFWSPSSSILLGATAIASRDGAMAGDSLFIRQGVKERDNMEEDE